MKIQGKSDNQILDEIIEELTQKYNYSLVKTGWYRTTYDIIINDVENSKPAVRIESYVVENGEIIIYDKKAYDFVKELAKRIETEFKNINETIIVEELGESPHQY